MKIRDFFGLDLSQSTFSIDFYLKQKGLLNKIKETTAVHSLTERHGEEHFIVRIAKRQAALKYLKPLINAHMLPHDTYYYTKEINTATDHDRRYDAEEQFLTYCLIIASGKSLAALERAEFTPTVRALRQTIARKRFERYWGVLAEQTGDNIKQFKEQDAQYQGAKGESHHGLFATLFRHGK